MRAVYPPLKKGNDMKRIHFHLGVGYVGAVHDEIVEFEDNATNEEIEEEFNERVNGYEDASWWEEE